jgi:hypothetical protein
MKYNMLTPSRDENGEWYQCREPVTPTLAISAPRFIGTKSALANRSETFCFIPRCRQGWQKARLMHVLCVHSAQSKSLAKAARTVCGVPLTLALVGRMSASAFAVWHGWASL